eukprot:141312_1
MPANAYGELNPLYPTYEDKDIELNELIRYFQFSYQPSSQYKGTAVFEILDGEDTYIMAIRADPSHGVTGFREVPSDDEISFHCTLPYDTFHDVFWGYTTAKTLVMGGGCKIKDWAYRSAYNFGISFDMTSSKWVEYYESGCSIKPMQRETRLDERTREIMHGIEDIHTVTKTQRIAGIGADLPQSAQDTEFMYQWQPMTVDDTINATDIDANTHPPSDWFRSRMDMWRDTMRNRIEMNNNKHISVWDHAIGRISAKNDHRQKMDEYRQHLNFNPLILGKNIAMKWRDKIKIGSSMMMDEYFGWYSQYSRHRIGDVSLSLVHKSMNKLNTFVYKQTTENELLHFSLLNSMF